MKLVRELKLINKAFAEELVAHLNANQNNAKLEEKDGKFVVSYELTADAQSDDRMDKMMDYMMRRMDAMAQHMWSYIDDMYEWRSKHGVGHLPAMTPSAMSKMLKVCGMDGDYEVMPRPLYASHNASIEFGVQELKDALVKINEMADKAEHDSDVSKLINIIKSQRDKAK